MTLPKLKDTRRFNARSLGQVGGWLPKDPKAIKKYVDHIVELGKANPPPRNDNVQNLANYVEQNGLLFMMFTEMLDEVPTSGIFVNDPEQKPEIHNLSDLWTAIETIVAAPPYFPTPDEGGINDPQIGTPINAILAWPMGTKAGFAAFARNDVNLYLQAILNDWGSYLKTLDSTSSLANWVAGLGGISTFSATYEVPDPTNTQTYGYTSWDNFFTRQYQPGLRPVDSPSDDTVIVQACQSSPFNIQTQVQVTDNFWIKAQRYSLTHMLNNNATYVSYFDNGTVYQAFLSATSFHRWWAPVSGTIEYLELIPGTYYSEPLSEGFSPDSGPANPDPGADELSQGYISAVAARGIVVINADNASIGKVCLVFVGMAEVSSVDFSELAVGKHLNKGDEMGMFHFGGSSHCVIFPESAQLTWAIPQPDPTNPNTPQVNIGSKIATVPGVSSK